MIVYVITIGYLQGREGGREGCIIEPETQQMRCWLAGKDQISTALVAIYVSEMWEKICVENISWVARTTKVFSSNNLHMKYFSMNNSQSTVYKCKHHLSHR